jgi:Fe-S cluster assembly protein SufD
MNAEEAKDFYLNRFAGQERGLVDGGREWTRDVRRDAIARFGALGFPTTHDEEWRYTSVAPIVKVPFASLSPAVEDGPGDGGRIDFFDSENLSDCQLIFVDGRFSRCLSHLGRLPKGVIVGSLAAAMTENRAKVEPHWARYADYQEQSFVALNTALMEDGAFMFVPDGVVLEVPIHFVFLTAQFGATTASHPRNLIVLGRACRATVVESYLGTDDDLVYFANPVTEIVLGENAVLDHYKVQRESAEAFHVATQQARLERGSALSSHSIALGAALARNEVNAALDGEGGDCTLNGLYVTAGKQHVDNHTRIDHVKPHCTSREVYKGIMGGKSRGVFNGKIYVHKAAEKSDARQTNKNLLLSEEAWIDTKPQLEIYNNDVKCSHGSTIGQLDEDALFYLRARGIDAATAVGLLTQGFAADIIGHMKNAAVVSWMEKLLARKIESIARNNGKL